MPVDSPLYPQNYNNPAYATNIYQNNIPHNSPNPSHPEASRQHPYHNWDRDLAFNTLYTMQGFGGHSDYDSNDNDEESALIGPQTTHFNLLVSGLPPRCLLLHLRPRPRRTLIHPSAPLPSATATPQNLRIFPQADASISSSPVAALVPRKRRVGSVADPVIPAAASPPIEGVVTPRRLVYRANIFGPGLHDNRQRPFTPSSTPSSTPSRPQGKENEVVHVSLDDDSATGPVRKKSRKELGARSIRSIQDEDPVRGQAMEIGYGHIRHKVMTNEKMTWIEGREAVAELAQEGLDYGFRKLELDPADFAPVTEKEQDLMRERVWGTRKAAKYAAREIVKGPSGYGLIQCACDDKPELIASTGAANRAIVATLVLKSGLVYSDPFDRTLRGSMYKHPAIQAMAEATVFKNVLADGVQHPDWFDDAPATPDDDPTQPPHKPQFSAVPLNVLICALRGAISEWSSGHWVAETFSRKVYYSQFVADLKTFREWQEYTSNPTVLTGNGPVRTLPPSFLARTLQESITEKARLKLFKDIVAPRPLN
ncbi:hypothetical protein B0H14DRAFT_2565403 [Mycena olivaceomarginata]|nr:hypothetical protein B0H14DRAFT_2565403 [Mycena olivaceomarginata]